MNKYIVAAAIAIVIVFASYFINFFVLHGYAVSAKTTVWAELGDYAGGLLGPIFSFLSLILLIKSLSLQNEANKSLRDELKNSRQTEKLRSFEALFFNMIASQKELFDSFKIEQIIHGKQKIITASDAVISIEDDIEGFRVHSDNNKEIIEFLEDADSNDQIFGIVRAFYIIVKMISEKLSSDEGFSSIDRCSHLHTLINFTDFSQLRLIMISMQFMDYHSIQYLKEHEEFNEILKEIDLSYDLYP